MSRRIVAGGLVGLLALVGVGGTAGAQQLPPGVPGLSPEVAALPASSPALDAAESRRDRAVAARDRDRAELTSTTDSLDATTVAAAATAALAARRGAQLVKVDGALDAQRAAVRSLATEWFVSGTSDQRALDPTLGADQLEELRRQAVLGATAAGTAEGSVRFLAERRAALQAEVDDLQRSGDRLAGRLDALTARRDDLTATVASDEAAVADAESAVVTARWNALIDGTDIPTVSLDAYWRAANTLALTQPACGMTWWILAGIGRTESRHGTYLGATVAPDGTVSPPILGPPLDGAGFQRVGDSDGGSLDGDATVDRAVGPMQFLPSAWKVVGRDGNGDGRADPQDIYDAALGAGTYLCRRGSVADDTGMRAAYLTYNRSLPYVDVVVGYATGYRDAVPLPGRRP